MIGIICAVMRVNKNDQVIHWCACASSVITSAPFLLSCLPSRTPDMDDAPHHPVMSLSCSL